MISKNKIKYIRSLELKKNRNKEGKFVAEGFKVVDDLLALQPADLIVATGEWLRGKHFGAETEVIEVTDEELKKISFLQHPQQVLAVFRQATSGDYSINTSELSLALDGVQDPGNLGTIIRTADAFGADGIILSEGCPDCYSPKVLRSAMGSVFRLPIWTVRNLAQALEAMRQEGFTCFGAALDGTAIRLGEFSFPKRSVAVVGNEGNGISRPVLEVCQKTLYIPMKGEAESLNAGVASSLILWEMCR